MVMARWTATVQDAEGNAVPGCEIEVRNANTGLLTQVYSDRDGTAPLGNPFVSADATFGFHVVGGAYRITARKGSFQALWNYVGIGTAQELDEEGLVGYINENLAGAVLTSAQQLNEGQKEQARLNIGAVDVPALQRVSEEVDRSHKDGIFQVPSAIGHRMGQLLYRIEGTRAVVLSDWQRRWLPAAWNCHTPAMMSPALSAYYVRPSGLDSNSGDSWSSALQSVATAIAKGDRNIIFCEGDGARYDLTKSMGAVTINRDLCIIAVGSKPAFFMPQRETTWTAVSGSPGVFQSDQLGGTPTNVVDGRVQRFDGSYNDFVQVASLSEVAANPGSWCIGPNNPSTASVYVHMPNAVTPTNANCWVMREVAQRFDGGTGRLHLHNIHALQFGGARNGGAGSTFSASNCFFSNRYNQNGVQILDVDLAIFIECGVPGNANDGLNYTANNGKSPHFLEIDCWGTVNRATGTGNASSAHGDCVGMRFNTSAWNNNGPGIADIDNVKSFNAGCVSDYNGLSNPNSNADGIQSFGNAEMWLHTARAAFNSGVQIRARGNSIMRVRDVFPAPIAEDEALILDF